MVLEILPGELAPSAQPMVWFVLVVAVKVMAAPPTFTVAWIGVMSRVGIGVAALMVMAAVAVRSPALADTMAVLAPPAVGGV